MGIEGKDAGMKFSHILIFPCRVNEPLEQRKTIFAKPFRMPLHSHYVLVFGAFNSLYDAIL